MTFFKIGTTDLTPWVNIQNYDVNQEPLYESWTDGNWRERRSIVRQRIGGTLKLGFSAAADFAMFMGLLASQRHEPEGYYDVTLYVNNTGQTVTLEAYLDVSGADKWDLVNHRQWQVQTLTITGR